MKKKYNLKSSNPKRKRIIILVIILLIICVGIYLFFNTDFFRTKRYTFIKYLKTTTDSVELLKDTDIAKYNKQKEEHPYIRSGSMKILSSSNVANSNIMDKLKLTINTKNDLQNERTNSDVVINYGSSRLATISYIREKNLYGIYSPEISSSYICVRNENLKNLFDNLQFDNDGTIISSVMHDINFNNSSLITDEFKSYDISTILEISDFQEQHIKDYFEILKNNVSDEAYIKVSNVKLEIEGEEYKTTQYIMNVSGVESANLQVALLSELAQDSVMLDFLSSKMTLLNLPSEMASINSLNQSISSKAEEIRQAGTAEDFKIVVSVYKQKNIQTEIFFGETKIIINQLSDNDDNPTSIFTVNDSSIKLTKKNSHYIVKVSTTNKDSIKKSIEIDYSRTGNMENNNIVNNANITVKDGIKSVNYEYTDTVKFVDEASVGDIRSFSGSSITILNDYSPSQIKVFIDSLKKKINQVYVKKGSGIGINLDPIFE